MKFEFKTILLRGSCWERPALNGEHRAAALHHCSNHLPVQQLQSLVLLHRLPPHRFLAIANYHSGPLEPVLNRTPDHSHRHLRYNIHQLALIRFEPIVLVII